MDRLNMNLAGVGGGMAGGDPRDGRQEQAGAHTGRHGLRRGEGEEGEIQRGEGEEEAEDVPGLRVWEPTEVPGVQITLECG